MSGADLEEVRVEAHHDKEAATPGKLAMSITKIINFLYARDYCLEIKSDFLKVRKKATFKSILR